MKIELEKKFNLTKEDYKIIRDNCEFIEEINLKDYYLDKNMILTKNNYFLRLRNGQYELKISRFNSETKMVSSEEYETEEEINKCLEKYNMTIDDANWSIFVDTIREKYKYNFNWNLINIDVEEYQYWTRYELEVVYNEENKNSNRVEIESKLSDIMDNFIKELWLIAQNDINSSKIITCAMYQNIEMYEILTKNSI